MESSQEPGREAQGGACLISLPDNLLALTWPKELVAEGLCVGSKDLARALLAAPSLDLSRRKIGVKEAKALARTLAKMKTLQELYLADNELGAEGGKAVGASLQHLTSLQALYLSSNNLGHEVKQELMALLSHVTGLIL